jgi:hypothetical protein
MNRPARVAAAARPGSRVIGWKVDEADREALLRRFPPRYGNVVADHVTLKSKVSAGSPLPPLVDAEILGRADDGSGVEAMVVAVDGGSDRPDGGTYHITWSLGPGRRAQESNDVIARHGWERLPEPVAVKLTPARFP